MSQSVIQPEIFYQSLQREILREARGLDGFKYTASSKGYIILWDGRKARKSFKGGGIHIPLLRAFQDPPTVMHSTIHHVNCNHMDNRLINLMWVTDDGHWNAHRFITKNGRKEWQDFCRIDPLLARMVIGGKAA